MIYQLAINTKSTPSVVLIHQQTRRYIISSIKKMNPPEAAIHGYLVDLNGNKTICSFSFLKVIDSRVRLEGESISLIYE